MVTSARQWCGKTTSRQRMLNLGFVRLESEPGCFVKKGATPKDAIIVVVHVDDLLSVGETKASRLEKTLKLKRVKYIENVLFPGDHIKKYKDEVTLKGKDAYVDNMLAMVGMDGCKPTNTPMVRKESAANGDEEMLEGGRDVSVSCGPKSLAMESSSPTRGHKRRLKRVLRYIQGTRDMQLELVRPQEQLTEMVAGVMDRVPTLTKRGSQLLVVS